MSALARLKITNGHNCGQNDRMQPLHYRASGLAFTAAFLTAGLVLAGCGGSGSSSNPPPAPPTTSSAPPSTSPSSPPANSSEPTSGPGAVQAIETNWAKFFDAKTPIPQRIALLENGQQFADVIHAQANFTLAKLATAKVTHVTLTGTSQAAVTYSILISGKTGLGGQAGVAVYQDGVWKVGDSSFCGLLKIENAGSSKGLPAGCKA